MINKNKKKYLLGGKKSRNRILILEIIVINQIKPKMLSHLLNLESFKQGKVIFSKKTKTIKEILELFSFDK